jgi:hypothetical protein
LNLHAQSTQGWTQRPSQSHKKSIQIEIGRNISFLVMGEKSVTYLNLRGEGSDDENEKIAPMFRISIPELFHSGCDEAGL